MIDAVPTAAVVFDRDLNVVHRNVAADAILSRAPTVDAVLRTTHGVCPDVNWRQACMQSLSVNRPTHVGGTINVTLTGLACDAERTIGFGLLSAIRGESPATTCAGDAPLATPVEARVAHELNNPLDGVLRYVNLTIRTMGEQAPPDVADYLDRSRNGLMQMTRIVSEMLGRSRTAASDPGAIGINQVVEDAVKTFQNRATESGVVITESYRNEHMPAIRGIKLFQVCCNLIKNALDAMPDGGTLTVNTGVSDQRAVIRIEDTGHGLPANTDHLFDTGYSTKAPNEGSGLGLAISKELVEQMGGTLTADHRTGGGAVFSISIPLDPCPTETTGSVGEETRS